MGKKTDLVFIGALVHRNPVSSLSVVLLFLLLSQLSDFFLLIIAKSVPHSKLTCDSLTVFNLDYTWNHIKEVLKTLMYRT